MQRVCVGITIAVLAFGLGIATSTVWSRYQRHASKSASAQSRDEEWHRLYEAAGLTGNAENFHEVNERLLCANSAGVPDAWQVVIEFRGWCQKADGTIHELRVNDTSEYGSFYKRIKASHSVWTLQNLDFVRSISSAKMATAYVSRHEWPPDK